MIIYDEFVQPLIDEIELLQSENKFLRQRVGDFNKKTWFPVHEENLNLAKENRALKLDNELLKSSCKNNQGIIKRMRNEMESNYKDEKYQKLNNDFNTAINKAKIINEENLKLANENKLLKEVIKSVEAFTKQYSK